MIRRAFGFTLIEVMISVGIVAVLGLSIGIVFGNINHMAAKPEAIVSAAVIQQTATLIFKNSNLCDNSLRPAGANGAGAHVPVTVTGAPTGTTATIDHIEYYDPYMKPVYDDVAISAHLGDPLNPPTRVGQNMYVSSITFQEQIPGQGRSKTYIGGTQYDVYAGYIKISFAPGATPPATPPSADMALAGGVAAPVIIPLNIAVNHATNQIDYCAGNASYSDICNQAGGVLDGQGNCSKTVNNYFDLYKCPPSPPPFDCNAGLSYPWVGVWLVHQFNTSTGAPECGCYTFSKTQP
jgi:prepilin-type N-terminal cleavage/methylation domain-containing protein